MADDQKHIGNSFARHFGTTVGSNPDSFRPYTLSIKACLAMLKNPSFMSGLNTEQIHDIICNVAMKTAADGSLREMYKVSNINHHYVEQSGTQEYVLTVREKLNEQIISWLSMADSFDSLRERYLTATRSFEVHPHHGIREAFDKVASRLIMALDPATCGFDELVQAASYAFSPRLVSHLLKKKFWNNLSLSERAAICAALPFIEGDPEALPEWLKKELAAEPS